jgi:hypothetical protein
MSPELAHTCDEHCYGYIALLHNEAVGDVLINNPLKTMPQECSCAMPNLGVRTSWPFSVPLFSKVPKAARVAARKRSSN